MKRFLVLSIFLTYALGKPQGIQNHQNNNGNQVNRQAIGNRLGGLSFAIPGLSLLAGNNGGGGNLFGPVTVTRTVVSTVSTVTTASFRTCVVSTGALMPCVAGRRKREVNECLKSDIVKPEKISATPAMHLIVGQTTIKDPESVSEYLEAHKPSTQSIIYPPGVQPFDVNVNEINPNVKLDASEDGTTSLYPSQDTPDTTELAGEAVFDDEDTTITSTETPSINFDQEEHNVERGRVGLGRTSTVTTVIRVTSVATSLATGTMATLMISYAGCLPPSLPISGPPCIA